MLHKTMLVLATALALGGAAVSTSAFAHDGGHGGGHFYRGGHFGGGFHEHGFHHHGWHGYGWDDGFWPGYLFDGACYEPVRYHTATGWHMREVDVCAY